DERRCDQQRQDQLASPGPDEHHDQGDQEQHQEVGVLVAENGLASAQFAVHGHGVAGEADDAFERGTRQEDGGDRQGGAALAEPGGRRRAVVTTWRRAGPGLRMSRKRMKRKPWGRSPHSVMLKLAPLNTPWISASSTTAMKAG